MRTRTARDTASVVTGSAVNPLPYRTKQVQISEVEIVDFCSRTGDDNTIHHRQPRVVPALLLMEKLARLFQQGNLIDGIPMFREIISQKFLRSLHAGDFIYANYSMQTVKTVERLNISVVEVAFKVYDQTDRVVGEGIWEMTILPKPESN